MDVDEQDIAREFWQRVDSLRGKMQLKELADIVEMSFVTLRNQKSGATQKLPKTIHAIRIAKALGTTVEYLVTGAEPPRSATSELQKAYQEADDTIKQIVRIALKLDQKQTEKREIV